MQCRNVLDLFDRVQPGMSLLIAEFDASVALGTCQVNAT
jgi:hypothetical protein